MYFIQTETEHTRLDQALLIAGIHKRKKIGVSLYMKVHDMDFQY